MRGWGGGGGGEGVGGGGRKQRNKEDSVTASWTYKGDLYTANKTSGSLWHTSSPV